MKRSFFILAAACVMAACAQPSGQTADTAAGASFDEVVASRRSIRSYDATKTISEAEVRTLIATAQEAPSWANTQTSRYYVAFSKEKADAVSTFVKGRSGFGRNGEPANEVGDGWGAYDNGLSDAHLVLKARAMGFDTLIMGGRDAKGLRSLFQIPEEEAIMAVIALGHRAADPQRPARKPLDEIVKFF